MASLRFLEACKGGKLQKVKACIKDEIDVNLVGDKQKYDNKTGLILAAEHNHSLIISLLIGNGAEVDAVDKYGMTALHHAAFKGHLEVCKLLISSDADIDCYDKAMLTPLHEAASSGKGSIIKLLLKSGANVVLTDKNNKTALDIAKDYNRLTCVKYLEKGLEKHNKRMSKKMSLKAASSYSTSNEIKHEHTLNPSKKSATKKHPKSANSVSSIPLSSKKHNHHKKKKHHHPTTETEKMRTAITQLNLFGNEASESLHALEALKSQNFGLNERINKLQKEKKALKKQISDGSEDRKLLSEAKEELNELKQSMKIIQEENEKQDAMLVVKEREVTKLKQSILQNKKRHSDELKQREQKYKDKLVKMEQKYSTKTNDDVYGQKNEDEINEIIEECGDDLEKLKKKLYDVMSILNDVNAENAELNEEIETLQKEHHKKMDAMMSGYGAVRNELSAKSESFETNDDEKSKHKRKSSKILRKTARFEKWMNESVALPQYILHFHEHAYDRIDVVKNLDEAELKKIGIHKVGHRRLIMDKIRELINKKEENTKQSVVSDEDIEEAKSAEQEDDD